METMNHEGHEGTRRKPRKTKPSWYFVSFVVYAFVMFITKLHHDCAFRNLFRPRAPR